MIVARKEVQLVIKVERRRRVNRVIVLEIAPGVRAGEVNSLAAAIREVPRIGGENAERSGSGTRLREA